MRIIFLAGLCLMSLFARAESIHPDLTDKWQFNLGVLQQEPEATIRSTAPGDPETEIDLDDLGLDDSVTVPQIGARWRFSNKWALNLLYSDFGLSGGETVSSSFNYDGTTYPVNASLKTNLDITLYIATIDYAFWQSDKAEWGVGLGLHAIDLDASIKGSLNNLALTSTGADFLAPLPNLRIFARYAFTPKLLTSVSAGWLGAEIDKYDGQLLVASASLDYRVSKRWSIGLNYQLTDIDMDVDDGLNVDSYDISLKGFAITAKYSIPQ